MSYCVDPCKSSPSLAAGSPAFTPHSPGNCCRTSLDPLVQSRLQAVAEMGMHGKSPINCYNVRALNAPALLNTTKAVTTCVKCLGSKRTSRCGGAADIQSFKICLASAIHCTDPARAPDSTCRRKLLVVASTAQSVGSRRLQLALHSSSGLQSFLHSSSMFSSALTL